MNNEELARKMLEWSVLRRQLNDLEIEISDAIMKRKSTQIVGSCKATYNKGRVVNDYRSPVMELLIHLQEIGDEGYKKIYEAISRHTKIEESTSWSKVCRECDLEGIELEEPQPSVSIKLLEDKDGKEKDTTAD